MAGSIVSGSEERTDGKLAGCCDEAGCRRKQPIGIYRGDFGGQVYAVTRSRERSPGHWVALERHIITGQMRNFIRANEAWVREVLEGQQ